MGRHVKVLDNDKVDRRELGYYYTPNFIADYISERLLMINPNGEKVLDPCVGQEEMIKEFLAQEKKVDGIDVFRYKENYQCNFEQKDFIEYYREFKNNNMESQLSFDDLLDTNDERITELDYDYYIANPPYNCHEVNYIRDNKKELQELFSDVGVHNMYSMFISAIIDIAKEGALIGIITYDSFFTARAHKNLRKKILSECTIHEITMGSNDLFHDQDADVRTSILILQKGKSYQRGVFVNNRSLSREILKSQLSKQLEDLKSENVKKYKIEDIILSNSKDNNELIIECPDDIKLLFSNERLGEKFDCMTGISTGKDALYLSEKRVDPFIVPFYKNPGKDRFYTENDLFLHKDFLKYDKEFKNFIVRNKQHLYKSGITCSSMGVEFTASRLPENSTFGVNANIICKDEDVWWLMAYLNSNLVTYLVRGILIRSNMITSGYVSRIPLIRLNEDQKKTISQLSIEAYERAKNKESYDDILLKINTIINSVSGISEETISTINKFKLNLIKNT